MWNPDNAMELWVDDASDYLPESQEEAVKQARAEAGQPRTGGKGGRNWKRSLPPSMTEPQPLPEDRFASSPSRFGEAPAASPAPATAPTPEPAPAAPSRRLRALASTGLSLLVGAGFGYWLRWNQEQNEMGG